tara:strand:+ start:9252 stop:9716 length:465 start_codon:yes stop_codon:yes gene_type:complete
MSGVKIISVNKKARMEFAVEDTYEAGMVLTGTEVKSIRDGHVSLKESFGDVRDGEVWLVDCHINPYGHGNVHNHETTRLRKLLLHKNEIRRLIGKINERGYALVPLKMYFKAGKVKLEIGLGKGKKLHDRREDLKKRDANREIERALRDRNKGR